MPSIIQILYMPFLACALISSILGYLGIHVLKREVIFIDIALAQIAAVGSIIAHLAFNVHSDSLISYACSFGLVLIASAFYALVRNTVLKISLEAIIGISYAIAAAAALFLVGIAPGGHIHVQQILSGSLLWTSWRDIVRGLLVFITAGFCFYLFRKPMITISNSYGQHSIDNLKIVLWDFVFYVILGIVITLAVQIAGVVVVFAYLIIPATISACFSNRLGVQLVIIWVTSVTASIAGLIFAYYLDFSIGPAISMFLGCELVIVGLINKLQQTRGVNE